MNRLLAHLLPPALALGVWALLRLLPEPWTLQTFCRLPALGAAAWLAVPLETPFTFRWAGIPFAVTRSCSAEGFFSLLLALLLCRRPKWAWAALPIAWGANTLRIVAACHAARLLPTFAHPRLLHQSIGLCCFLFTLALLLFWLERTPAHE